MPKYVTRCNIPIDCPVTEGGNGKKPCGAEIVISPGIVPPKLGEPPEPKTKKFVEAIIGHFQKRHPQHCQHALNQMEQFLAFQSVGFTQSEDPGVIEFMAGFGSYLCGISTLPVSDQMIVELVTRMGLTMEDPQRAKIIEAMTYVRNFQLRKLSPQSPAKSRELSPVTP